MLTCYIRIARDPICLILTSLISSYHFIDIISFIFCSLISRLHSYFFFFFNDTAPPEIYPLPLHDPLPISRGGGGLGIHHEHIPIRAVGDPHLAAAEQVTVAAPLGPQLHRDDVRARPRLGHRERPDVLADRKSTRLNSSHGYIPHSVFCFKKRSHHPDPTRLRRSAPEYLHGPAHRPRGAPRGPVHRRPRRRRRAPRRRAPLAL